MRPPQYRHVTRERSEAVIDRDEAHPCARASICILYVVECSQFVQLWLQLQVQLTRSSLRKVSPARWGRMCMTSAVIPFSFRRARVDDRPSTSTMAAEEAWRLGSRLFFSRLEIWSH
jgi:hypothetical protein